MVFNEVIMTKQFPDLEIISYSDILLILYCLIKNLIGKFLVTSFKTGIILFVYSGGRKWGCSTVAPPSF